MKLIVLTAAKKLLDDYKRSLRFKLKLWITLKMRIKMSGNSEQAA